jgi:hypothetical protein
MWFPPERLKVLSTNGVLYGLLGFRVPSVFATKTALLETYQIQTPSGDGLMGGLILRSVSLCLCLVGRHPVTVLILILCPWLESPA